MTSELPRILFFNINGSGLGHLSRCLAYARRMQGRARPVFFSTASAIEIIHEMGFEADYFVSEFWSRSHINAWNRELAMRFGLLLEELRPHAGVFDGTPQFQRSNRWEALASKAETDGIRPRSRTRNRLE